MKRSVHSASGRGLVLVAALLLGAGCGSRSDTTSTSASPTDTASAPEAAAERSITVTAVGTAEGRPDSMTVTLAVELTAPSTTEVLDQVGDRTAALKEYLLGAGIPETDIHTSQLSVYPTYGGYTEYGPGEITGYTATVSTAVTLGDFDQAATIVDGAAAAVGDAFRVYGLTWTIRDTSALAEEARTDAVEAAREQAGQLAAAAGLLLGPIESIAEQPASGMYAYGEGGGSGDIPFDAGTATVSVSLTVRFSAS